MSSAPEVTNVAGIELEWFGCTTYRVKVDGLTLMLDAYLTKVPGNEPAGLGIADIPIADFIFITHAHFDHMVDAAPLAIATGATVVANYEAMRVLRASGVPDAQLLPASGGETVDCGHGVTVRILPGLHSCLFAASDGDSSVSCLGDLGIPLQVRHAKIAGITKLLAAGALPYATAYFTETADRCSSADGGQLTYLVETPYGSILLNASAGYYTGLVRDLEPDFAILALAGRPNVDGEPFQGSLADFLLAQVRLIRPRHVMLCHHDALLPPILPAVETSAALQALAAGTPDVSVIDLTHCRAIRLPAIA